MSFTKLSVVFCLLCSFGCSNSKDYEVNVRPSLEYKTEKGVRYSPSTQSFLRDDHWLETVNKANIQLGDNYLGDIKMQSSDPSKFFEVKNVNFNQLVPRLHYSVNGTPDRFDLFNLMLAEFSRNGLSFPFGRDGDQMTHFQTDLEEGIPWKLKDDYQFQANPLYKPVRFSVVNNCLNSGLWELNATDKTGEVYHSWFDFPKDVYYDLVAKVNKIDLETAKQALEWKEDEIKIDLDRLRTVKKDIKATTIGVVDEEISYSSQGSRRKLSAGFVTCKKDDTYVAPRKLSDLLTPNVKMAKFEKPGLYSIKNRMEFNFEPYGQPQGVKVREVDPLTSYGFEKGVYKRDDKKYIELEIILPDNKKLIVGNLPLYLMTQQEDFSLHGFGVGILSAGGFAERRKLLLQKGFHPSFAYLVKETPEGLVALNSHGEGLEQVFIRSFASKGYWDITFTSYERITDIVKYRIAIPQELIDEQIKHNEEYITPVYFSYRDDNLR